MTQIMNDGVFGGILREIAKTSPELLTEKDKEYLAMLDTLPCDTWVTLDENQQPLTQKEVGQKERKHLSRFTTLDGEPNFHLRGF